MRAGDGNGRDGDGEDGGRDMIKLPKRTWFYLSPWVMKTVTLANGERGVLVQGHGIAVVYPDRTRAEEAIANGDLEDIEGVCW